MDLFIPVLFLAIFYLGPVLLKQYRAKNNIPPLVPEKVHAKMMSVPPKIKKIPAYKESTMKVKVATVVDKIERHPTIREVPTGWQGKLEQTMLVNGVMFAEILQPPRAYRPMVKHTK